MTDRNKARIAAIGATICGIVSIICGFITGRVLLSIFVFSLLVLLAVWVFTHFDFYFGKGENYK